MPTPVPYRAFTNPLSEAAADLEARLPEIPHVYGALADSIHDDSTAIMDAILGAASAGRSVFFPAGLYALGGATPVVFNPEVELIFAPGAIINFNGQTVTGTAWVQDGYARIFNTTTGALAVTFKNDRIRAEWWGAIGVMEDNVPVLRPQADLNIAALNAAKACINDTTLDWRGQYVISATFTLPNTTFTLKGHGTHSGLRAHPDVPALTLYDFSACNGPDKIVEGLSAIGAISGSQQGIGFFTDGSNGVTLRDCWARGLTYGFIFDGTYLAAQNCIAEFCYEGVVKTANPGVQNVWEGWVFNDNFHADIVLQGDCYGMVIGSSTHARTGTGNVQTVIGDHAHCVRLDGALGVRLGTITIQNAGAPSDADVLYAKGTSRDCVVGAIVADSGRHICLVEEASSVRVETIESKGAVGSVLYWVNVGTGGCSVGRLVAHAGLTGSVGIHADGIGDRCIIESADIDGMDTGMILASELVELHNVRIQNSTTADVVVQGSTLGSVYADNVVVETPGDWDVGAATPKILRHYTERSLGIRDYIGKGAPAISAAKGATWRRTDGGAGSTFYINESGSTTWAAK